MFPPTNKWVQKENPYKYNNIPNQLKTTNVVQEVIPYYIPCESLHEEASCYVAWWILEQGIPNIGSSEEVSCKPEYINVVDHVYLVSKET